MLNGFRLSFMLCNLGPPILFGIEPGILFKINDFECI